MLSIVIPIYKRSEFTEQTLASVATQAMGSLEFILCVDGTDAETYKQVKQFYNTTFVDVKVVAPHDHVGVNRLRNLGIEQASNENVFVINDDILISEGFDLAIEKLLKEFSIVCPLYTEGENKFAGVPKRKRENINGHARAIRKSVWSDVGTIPDKLKLWYGDDRVFRRLTDMKRTICWTDQLVVHHFRSKTVCDPQNKAWIDEMILQDAEAWKEILVEHRRFDERFSHLLKQ